MGIYLCGGRENTVPKATRYGREEPGFQPQWWQDKHYQSTSLRIAVFKKCKNIMKFIEVAFYTRDAFSIPRML